MNGSFAFKNFNKLILYQGINFKFSDLDLQFVKGQIAGSEVLHGS